MKRLLSGASVLTLVILVGALVYEGNCLARIAIPEAFYYASPYASNLAFAEHHCRELFIVYGKDALTGGIHLPPEETLTQMREEARRSAIQRERSNAIEHGTNTFLFLLPAAGLYLALRRLARRQQAGLVGKWPGFPDSAGPTSQAVPSAGNQGIVPGRPPNASLPS